MMDFPFNSQDAAPPCRRRGPVALWALMAFVGIVLGAAALGAAMVTDTRDFAARHGAVLGTQAL